MNKDPKSAIVKFLDLDTNSEAFVLVRQGIVGIGLCVSVSVDGDVEVFMTKEEAERVAQAIVAVCAMS